MQQKNTVQTVRSAIAEATEKTAALSIKLDGHREDIIEGMQIKSRRPANSIKAKEVVDNLSKKIAGLKERHEQFYKKNKTMLVEKATPEAEKEAQQEVERLQKDIKILSDALDKITRTLGPMISEKVSSEQVTQIQKIEQEAVLGNVIDTVKDAAPELVKPYAAEIKLPDTKKPSAASDSPNLGSPAPISESEQLFNKRLETVRTEVSSLEDPELKAKYEKTVIEIEENSKNTDKTAANNLLNMVQFELLDVAPSKEPVTQQKIIENLEASKKTPQAASTPMTESKPIDEPVKEIHTEQQHVKGLEEPKSIHSDINNLDPIPEPTAEQLATQEALRKERKNTQWDVLKYSEEAPQETVGFTTDKGVTPVPESTAEATAQQFATDYPHHLNRGWDEDSDEESSFEGELVLATPQELKSVVEAESDRNWAIGGMTGSGLTAAAGIVGGAILMASGPIGWAIGVGILLAAAVVGVVGGITSYRAYSEANEKINPGGSVVDPMSNVDQIDAVRRAQVTEAGPQQHFDINMDHVDQSGKKAFGTTFTQQTGSGHVSLHHTATTSQATNPSSPEQDSVPVSESVLKQ